MGPKEATEGYRQREEDSKLLSEILEPWGDGEDGAPSKEDIFLLEQLMPLTP